MTREECEKGIAEKITELWDIYKEYNPNGYNLSMTVTDDLILFNNVYWANDINKPIIKIIERKESED